MTMNVSNDSPDSGLKPLKFVHFFLASIAGGGIVGTLDGLIISLLANTASFFFLGIVWGVLVGGLLNLILGYPLHILCKNADTKTRKLIFLIVGFIVGVILGLIIYNWLAAGTADWED